MIFFRIGPVVSIGFWTIIFADIVAGTSKVFLYANIDGGIGLISK